ncbi:MAG: DUF3298 domain-containing protein [Bacteroidota bacterium]
MKHILGFTFLFLLFSGCKDKDGLVFETKTLTAETCLDCPKVYLELPKATGTTPLAKTVNTALREEIISLLNYDDALNPTTIEEALTAFKEGYLELKRLYPDETMGWEAKITGKVLYEDTYVLTLLLDSYIFTGGAHGYTATRFLNFDKKKSKELENEGLFKKEDAFTKFAETKFREQENIPEGKSINYTGFMFEGDSFTLPENMGFTEEGFQLHYNPYEVASYADGPITLTIPYAELTEYLIKPKS